MPEDRRLAAIMFTDIVGYTALMGKDEDQAFKILAINREIHKTVLSRYNGTLIKEMGDGILASFTSNSDAVRCAIEIQQEAKSENIKLRIGIHEGEMVFAGTDVLGDGVNVASRLEELAEEGCINISGAVYKDIKNKAGIVAEFVEDKELKNVDEPIKVYRVKCEEPVAEQSVEEIIQTSKSKLHLYIIAGLVIVIAAILIWQFLPNTGTSPPSTLDTSEKTIAVIPFWNDSPDPDNAYFCRGMEEQIRVNLLKVSELKVESRQSVEKYRQNPDIDVITIGKELGVTFIVEGSVTKSGNDVRVTVQLIDAKTGDHIWAETYDGDYTMKLLDFQSNTAKLIASSLNVVITPDEAERIEKKPTANITAYDFILRAKDENQSYWRNYDTKHLKLSNKLIDRALELDSQSLEALGVKGGIYISESNYDSAYIYAKKMLKIDHEFSAAYYLIAEYHRFKGEVDMAIDNYKLTIKYSKQGDLIGRNWSEFLIGKLYCIDKNDYLKGMPYLQKGYFEESDESDGYGKLGYLSYIFRLIGDYERAERYNKKMLESGSESIWWFIQLNSDILQWQGRFKESINFLDSMSTITVGNAEGMCNRYLFHANVYLGFYNVAEQYINRYKEGYYSNRNIIWDMDSVLIAFTYKKIGKEYESMSILNSVRSSLENKLHKGQSYYILSNLALIHAILNEKEESLKYLSALLEMGQGSTWFDLAERNPIFEDLWDDPDFKAILKGNREKLEKVQAQINEMRERGEIEI
jgi:class 3 adenylate cyclase/TolB-like protein/tetratricopeptide (TPR) repeat protein